MHALRDCPEVAVIWRAVVPFDEWGEFFNVDRVDWFDRTLHTKNMSQVFNSEWKHMFATVLWRLWKRRCEVVFNPNTSIDGNKLLNIIESNVLELKETYPQGEDRRRGDCNISWVKPDEGFVKINMDEASKGNPGVAAAGGLLRNAARQWLTGFMAHLGICTNLVVKLQAIRYELELAYEHGYKKVICGVDAKMALDITDKSDSAIHPCGGLIEDIRVLGKRNWECRLQHTLCKNFFAGDSLAKETCAMDGDFEVLERPSACVLQWLKADERGVSFPRDFTI